ncbi:MAG: isoprenylcysteine carboxylmethyltransferase family protein [Opitutaceae bacterium]
MKRFLMTITPPGILVLLYLAAYAVKRWTSIGSCSIALAPLGYALIGAGAVLFFWAGLQFLLRKTTVLPIGNPSRIIVGGPFRFTRNPIYLADLVITLGIALCLGPLVYWAVPVALFWILNTVFIPEEERKMRAIFGDEFDAYAARVRRWL